MGGWESARAALADTRSYRPETYLASVRHRRQRQSSGPRLWLATLRDFHGYVLDGEQARIVWTNAFDGLTADIVVQYNINSVIHYVYLRDTVRIPADAGFNIATTRLEIWTELFEGPEPRLTPTTITLVPSDPANKNQPTFPDKQAPDTELDWGAMKLIQGCAFRVNPDPAAAPRENWPVSKQWISANQRRFIVESVDYEAIKLAIDGLKTAQIPTPPTDLGQPHPLYASATRSHSGAEGGLPPLPAAASTKTTLARWDARQTATWARQPGWLWDWTLVNNLRLDLQFGNGQKTGAGAVGKGTNDYWNRFHFPGASDTTMTNLLCADAMASGVSLRVQNAPGEWTNATGAIPFDSAAYADPGSGNITLTLANMPTGLYDVYLYGDGGAPDLNGVYTLAGVTQSTASALSLTNGPAFGAATPGTMALGPIGEGRRPCRS